MHKHKHTHTHTHGLHPTFILFKKIRLLSYLPHITWLGCYAAFIQMLLLIQFGSESWGGSRGAGNTVSKSEIKLL